MQIMKAADPKSPTNLLIDFYSQFDLEAIIEKIWVDLGGSVTRSDIKSVLIEAAPKYADARIMTYVPIFLAKEVRRRLLGRS